MSARGARRRAVLVVLALALGSPGAVAAARTPHQGGLDRVSVVQVLEAPPLRLGPLGLDEPVDAAFDRFGMPSSSDPDIFGTAHMWELPGGARVVVSAWDDGDREINGLFAEVPVAGSVDLNIHGGLVIGRATLQQVIDAWGPDYVRARHDGSDYVIAYERCAGPHAAVAKFHQRSAAGDEAGPLRMHEPVTSVLLAYADADPVLVGCTLSEVSPAFEEDPAVRAS